MTLEHPILLGSNSPRRRQIFSMLGLPHVVGSPDVDEKAIPYSTPRDLALKASLLKNGGLMDTAVPGQVVVTADTVVGLDGKVYNKPEDDADAARMLRELSGKTHQVLTGITVALSGGHSIVHAEESLVTFRNLTDTDISSYIATGIPRDKAGAYGIQDRAFEVVEFIQGDYFNVVGLPVAVLWKLLNEFIDMTPYEPGFRELTREKFQEAL